MSDLPIPSLLFDFSKRTLQDLVITSLDRAARHRKAAKAAWDEAVKEEAIGLLASYFIEHRQEMQEMAATTLEVKIPTEFPQSRKTA